MPNPFLEERLPVSVRMGASYGDAYNVEINQTADNSEYRRLVHPYPVRYFNIAYFLRDATQRELVAGLYHRAFGMFKGFRVRALDDYQSVNQPLQVITAGSVYQLQKYYGDNGIAPLNTLPVRTIFKPVAGSVVIRIDTHLQPLSAWSVDVTTGRVTMAANKTRSITAITQAAQAVVTVGAGHPFVTGDSVHFSGVVGMTQINGLRAAVTGTAATTITVAINSTGFTAYSSGGTVNTRPQTGETVRGDCEFDIPCRFNSRIDFEHVTVDVRAADNIEIVELINP